MSSAVRAAGRHAGRAACRAWLGCGLLLLAGCASSQPRPAPPPPAPRPPSEPSTPPAPPELLAAFAPSSREPLALEAVAQIAMQPAQARTSGQNTAGSVADVAFLPPDGRNLVAVGNDDRAWIADLQTGKAHWKSRPLGKDAERVAVCGNRFAVLTYAGMLAVYEWVPEGRGRVIDRGRFELGFGKLLGLFASCSQAAFATLDDKLIVFDTLLGSVARVVRDASFAQFESRVTESGWVFVNGARPKLLGLQGGETFEPQLGAQPDDGRLMQAFVAGPERIVTEHCNDARACVVRVLDFDGRPRLQHPFDRSGSVWVNDVPSRIAVSSDLRYLAWYRDGLALQVVELETGRRAELGAIPRTMSAVVAVAFSPYEAGRMAVTLTPAANQVTVYEIR